MDTFLNNFTDETVNLIYKQIKKESNKSKINAIVTNITNTAMKIIQPYLFTILGMLIIMFCTNLLQFYYYLRAFIHNKGSLEMLTQPVQ